MSFVDIFMSHLGHQEVSILMMMAIVVALSGCIYCMELYTWLPVWGPVVKYDLYADLRHRPDMQEEVRRAAHKSYGSVHTRCLPGVNTAVPGIGKVIIRPGLAEAMQKRTADPTWPKDERALRGFHARGTNHDDLDSVPNRLV
mmetsp:Transcript_106871/g.244773  ORF Transcript_106871/g.244773 Transcript_106871/m.244773 type:complete len:143 (-) Transcript_106871:8-436(-)